MAAAACIHGVRSRAYPNGPNAINPPPILRNQFNLFANVRPARFCPDIGCLNVGTWSFCENGLHEHPDLHP
jgi:isocitrate/isopropylmalate dehydrogenase